MESGVDAFKFILEINRLAADLHRLDDKSVTEVRKCMEYRMLENNPAGLNRA